jgi:hypothetical protein
MYRLDAVRFDIPEADPGSPDRIVAGGAGFRSPGIADIGRQGCILTDLPLIPGLRQGESLVKRMAPAHNRQVDALANRLRLHAERNAARLRCGQFASWTQWDQSRHDVERDTQEG